MFEDFSIEQINISKKNIFKHILRDFNMKDQLSRGQNSDEMPKDLRSTIFYQQIFNSAIWNNCDFTDVSGNGTIFRENDFFNSDLKNVSFQYCSFSDSIFQSSLFEGSNFANSTFALFAIQDSKIYGCSFVGTEFYSGILRNTAVLSSNFELCRFRKMLFENLDLRQLTLNYAIFENITMKNVCLPFLQIPYTFNGLQYVFNTTDSISFSSHSSSRNSINLEEYKEMISDFIIFFNDRNQYFPLTNCYIVQNKIEMAIACNETGVKISAELHDFRSLYFYCIQASQILKISKEKRILLYSDINTLLSNATLSGGEYHQFRLYFPRIKNLLFDVPKNNPVMTLKIYTNIEPNDYKKLSILLQALENVTSECNISLDSKHIEIRHNSPNVIDFFSSGQIRDLITSLQNIYEILEPIISNLASVITLGGAAGKFIKNPNLKKRNTLCKKQEYWSIVKLRKELNRLYLNDTLSQEKYTAINTQKDLLCKFADIKENLKYSGIIISALEIQFLDGKEDILDTFYQQNLYS